MSQGRQKKGQISGGRYRLVSSLCLSICQDKWHHERLVWADSAWWEVSALSYGSAGGICTGGPSCGNHCSVGRWARAIRPAASHQLSSLPSVCVTHLSHHPDHRQLCNIAGELHTWHHNAFCSKHCKKKKSYVPKSRM